MHTLAKNQHHNERLIRFCLEQAYPDGIITVERLIADNLINGTQVAELAVCKTNGEVAIHPVGIGQDLTDGSDVKTVTLQEEVSTKKGPGSTKSYVTHRFQIKDVNNKVGKLRVICYDPFRTKWIYFVIPHEAYSSLRKLTVSFNKFTGEVKGKYKQYQVNSWLDLCKS